MYPEFMAAGLNPCRDAVVFAVTQQTSFLLPAQTAQNYPLESRSSSLQLSATRTNRRIILQADSFDSHSLWTGTNHLLGRKK
jgi:hypothetical protein